MQIKICDFYNNNMQFFQKVKVSLSKNPNEIQFFNIIVALFKKYAILQNVQPQNHDMMSEIVI